MGFTISLNCDFFDLFDKIFDEKLRKKNGEAMNPASEKVDYA